MATDNTSNVKGSLYIMRHGRTDWNDRRKIQGRTDIPLNEEGRKMALDAAVKYADIKIDRIYCSTLVRAIETAELFARGKDIPIIKDERLVEMSFGVYEGFERSFDFPDCPVNVLFKDPVNYNPPVEGGESFDELYKRTGSFIDEIMPLVKDGMNILIIGHGAMNRSIINRIKGIPLKDYWSGSIENCKMEKLI